MRTFISFITNLSWGQLRSKTSHMACLLPSHCQNILFLTWWLLLFSLLWRSFFLIRWKLHMASYGPLVIKFIYLSIKCILRLDIYACTILGSGVTLVREQIWSLLFWAKVSLKAVWIGSKVVLNLWRTLQISCGLCILPLELLGTRGAAWKNASASAEGDRAWSRTRWGVGCDASLQIDLLPWGRDQ